MEAPQEMDSAKKLTQEEFTSNLEPRLKSPELRAARKQLLSQKDIKSRQRELGEPPWLATVSRLAISDRPVRIASRANSPQGSGVYRINNLVRRAPLRRMAAVLKSTSSSHPGAQARRNIGVLMRASGKRFIVETRSLRYENAAYGD